MKSITTILMLFLVVFTLDAQSYKTAFRADMCDCLEEESLKRQLTDNAFKTCLRETLPKYATQIDAQIVEEDANKKYYLGQLARKDLLVSMQTELIYTCDVYYKHLDFQLTSKKLIARENAKESQLETYDQQVALSPHSMSYFMRAKVHFNIGNIEEAESDINKSLELNPNKDRPTSTRHELLLLASIYEEQERFSDAIVLYDKVYLGDLDTQVARLRALADIKSGGTIDNIPKINKNEIIKNKTEIDKPKLNSQQRTRSENKRQKKGNTKAKSKKVIKKDTSSLRKLLKIGNG